MAAAPGKAKGGPGEFGGPVPSRQASEQRRSRILLLGRLLTCALAVAPEYGWPQNPGLTSPPRIIHVVVALCDNRFQGIVPVSPALGDGDDLNRNLYWGARYGVRTFLRASRSWEPVGSCQSGHSPLLERCVFRHRKWPIYLVADAYRGKEIRRAVIDFLDYAAGRQRLSIDLGGQPVMLDAGGGAALVAYVGHDGLMDFALDRYPAPVDTRHRDAVVLACASRHYFAEALRATCARPVLWTNGLLAPEAYLLEAAVEGWIRGDPLDRIRRDVARVYDRYQHCGTRAADKLFSSDWPAPRSDTSDQQYRK